MIEETKLKAGEYTMADINLFWKESCEWARDNLEKGLKATLEMNRSLGYRDEAWLNGWACAIDSIKARGAVEPKPLELPEKFDDWQSVGEWLHIVVDAVNELRKGGANG
jgi:hypothetical protein